MGHAIPKLQYLNTDTVGDTTIGDGTIGSIPDTTDIVVGMFARGTGIPAGATVGTKSLNAVTLAGGVLATANGAGVAVSFGYEVEFDYPPIEDGGEELSTNATTIESLSGIRQVAVNYVDGVRKFKFSFLSPTVYALLNTFLQSHALFGNSFRYYEDKTVSLYVDSELDSLKVTPRKISSRGANLYVWEVPLNFRRVL